MVVDGQVEGDLHAKEQIILRHTARVAGSIAAPRVTLEDGAVFRGGIEMDAGGKEGKPVVGKRADAGRDAAAEREDRSSKGAAGEKESGKSLQA